MSRIIRGVAKGQYLPISILIAGAIMNAGATVASIGHANIGAKAASQIDGTATQILHQSEVPGMSLAVVIDDRIAYVKSYGYAELPDRRANVDTRFAIGSITKQVTAAGVLLLVQRGKLSLDDSVAKFLPSLTDSKEVTVRELLSHTSGYQDYLWQEYLPNSVLMPTNVDTILSKWATQPLNFSPGSRWQYSGTNYVIAGRIIELVSGKSYERFVQQDLLKPLGISDAFFVDEAAPSKNDAVGYYRFGLGPPRVAPRAGRNWLFAMADLDMTARDLAVWDLGLIDHRLLNASMYEIMTSDVRTNDGDLTGYGLGLYVSSIRGTDGAMHPLLHHPGEISGFRSENWILPDTKSAVVVLTNAEFSRACEDTGAALQNILALAASQPRPVRASRETGRSDATPSAESPVEARMRRLLTGLARGSIDRSQLTPDADEVFTPQALHDLQQSLAPLGTLRTVRLVSTQSRAGLKHYTFAADYDERSLQIEAYVSPSGSIAELFVDAPR